MSEFFKDLFLILSIMLGFVFGYIINKNSYEELEELKNKVYFFYVLSFSLLIFIFFYNINIYLAILSFVISFIVFFNLEFLNKNYKKDKNHKNSIFTNSVILLNNNVSCKNIINSENYYKIIMFFLGFFLGIIIFLKFSLFTLFIYSSLLFINFIFLTSLNYKKKFLKIFKLIIYFLLPVIIFLFLKYLKNII